jgi:hypothetical protein
MALTLVHGQDAVTGVLQALAVSGTELGSGNEVVVDRATAFKFGLDDSAIGFSYKVSWDSGTTFGGWIQVAGGAEVQVSIPRGWSLTLDVKSDSGTPNLGGYAEWAT